MPTWYKCIHRAEASGGTARPFHHHQADACIGGSIDTSCYAVSAVVHSCTPDPDYVPPPPPPPAPTPGTSTTTIVIGVIVVVVVVSLFWWLSDERAKRDIELVRMRPDGIGIYRYRYLWSETFETGVLAQEVERVRPDAVRRGDDGWLRVNYAAIGEPYPGGAN